MWVSGRFVSLSGKIGLRFLIIVYMIATIFIVWCKSNSYYVNFCFHVSDFFLFVLFQKNSIGFLKKKCSANFQQQLLEGGFFSRFLILRSARKSNPSRLNRPYSFRVRSVSRLMCSGTN